VVRTHRLGHFYLYNKDGTLKNAITSGAWRASQIVAVDEKERVLYLRGNAREKGENVYYAHLYSVKLDGTGLTLLDPGNAHHFSTLSPTRKFVIDNLSRVDEAPRSVAARRQGQGGDGPGGVATCRSSRSSAGSRPRRSRSRAPTA